MFKPLKDFITFIQKNNTNTSVEKNVLTEDLNSSTDEIPSEDLDTPNMEKLNDCIIKTDIVNDYEEDDIEMQIKSSVMIKKPLRSPITLPNKTNTTSTICIVTTTPCTSTATLSSSSSTFTAKTNLPDFNQNLQKKTIYFTPDEDDELADFKYDPMRSTNGKITNLKQIPMNIVINELVDQKHNSPQSSNDDLEDNLKHNNMHTSNEDFCSVSSDLDDIQIITNLEETDSDLQQHNDEDDFDETFPDQNKILVTTYDDDDVLNTSIASSSDDPLALDSTIGPVSNDISLNNFESSANEEENDEASTSGELNWYDSDKSVPIKIKQHGTANIQSDKSINVYEMQQQQKQNQQQLSAKNLIKNFGENNKNLIKNDIHIEEPNDEMERNDNSDSGLGTETSSLLLQTLIDGNTTDNNSSHSDIQEICSSGKTIEIAVFENGTIIENHCTNVDDHKVVLNDEIIEIIDITDVDGPSSQEDVHKANIDGHKARFCDQKVHVAEHNSHINDQRVNIVRHKVHTDDSKINEATSSQMIVRAKTPAAIIAPLRSNLKRRFCDVNDIVTDGTTPSSSTSIDIVKNQIQESKKAKRSINFDGVHVYYFPRQQGFGCVPSAGGCTLGMGSQHIEVKRLSLAEHAAELRRAHRLQLQEVNPRGSSSDDTDESEEDYLSEGSGSDLDADSNGFLQPVSPKQRRAILKAAGVRKIDTSEKIECRDIRNSREVCGCTCREFCDPETCSCSLAGIKCQVDRAMFPCGCTRDACGNTSGRVEFNPARVRTHFIHTIMRLDMENRQQILPTTIDNGNCNYNVTTLTQTSMTINGNGSNTLSNQNGYYNMQTQSNYSSGYASPSYSHDSTINNTNYYHQRQSSSLYGSTNRSETSSSNANIIGQYQNLDSIDSGNVFSRCSTQEQQQQNTLQNYDEILPNYCSTSNSTNLSSTTTLYQNSLSFTYSHVEYQQEQQPSHTRELTTAAVTEVSSYNSTYNSCAVPSQPPYGTATTCNNISRNNNSSNTNASIISDNNFISLSSPIASSSRLSQINDLLQNNRNTTAALVAVSEHGGNNQTLLNTANSSINSNVNITKSIETQSPIIINENQQKECFIFDADLAMTTPSLNAINSAINNNKRPAPPPQSEPPPIGRQMRQQISSIDYDTCVRN